MIQKIKIIFFDVINDFKSTFQHAHDLLIDSPAKIVILLFLMVLFMLFYTAYGSHSQAEFYVNFSRFLIAGIAIFFVYCLSDYFWFLIKRKTYYKICLSHKKHINLLLKIVAKNNFQEDDSDYERIISSTAKDASMGHEYHVIRYAVLIILIAGLVSNIIPDFFLLSILIFGGMFFYVFLCEKQCIGQASENLCILIHNIKLFNKESPKKCKKFIMENEREEIKELQKLYKIVSEI